MKKITCMLLALVLTLTMFTSCSKVNTQTDTTAATNTMAEHETSTEPTTETVTEETREPQGVTNLRILKQFLNALINKDVKNIVSLIGALNYDNNASKAKILQAYSFFKDVDIKKYKILDSYNNEWFEVELTITKSSDNRFPVGTSRWRLEVNPTLNGLCITLFKRANKAINKISLREQSDAVEFCHDFSLELNCYKTVNDFNKIVPKDKKNFSWFCEGLIRFTNTLGDNYMAKRTLLESRAKETLGITAIDFTKTFRYNKATDSLYLEFLGGHSNVSSLASENFDPVSRRYTVVIDYYSDVAYILKAKTIRYIVQENEDDSLTLLSTKLLYDSGLDVISFSD